MMAGEYGREMVDLLPTLVWEVKMIQALAPSVDRYRAIQAQTLMIGGSKSPAYLKEALPVLAKTIPYAHWVIFPGLNHNAPDQYEPELIAAELKRFFL
jgi:pimeloyl-ACP methyl ester carboxylesterase